MKLHKGLGLLDVFAIATGAMISGIFILPGLAFEQAGPVVMVSYFFSGLLALSGLFSQAELTSAMPRAGGTYFNVTRSMGSAVGTVYGLITWLSMALKTAYELLFMGLILAMVVHLPGHLLAVVICLLFVGLNLIGAKEAGKIQAYLVLGILGLLVLFLILSLGKMSVRNFEPFLPKGWDAVLPTAGLVFVSFGGLLKVANIAEEAKKPGRNIPLAMLLSMIVVSVFYLLVVFACIAVLGPNLSGLQHPVAEASRVFMGNAGPVLYSVAAVLAIVSSANAGIMAASRFPLALARDEMLPAWLGKINARCKTPHPAILLTGVVIIAAMFVDVKILVKAASCVLILTYVFTCIAVIILRESKIQNYRPQFRSPLYPWIQVIGILGFDALLFGLGWEALLTCSVLVLCGFAAYWFYGRPRASKDYALLHLIERVTARELASTHLESELKDIIHERDEIMKDRFDHLVENCPVLDLEGPIWSDTFFDKAAEVLAADLDISKEVVYNGFLERESQGSTVLSPFLAIPHVVIEGEQHFDILLARCQEGIVFSEEHNKVHAVFVLIGTRDERSFHLMSLAAIAQIVQDEDFDYRWKNAKNIEALRDIVLLSKRMRN